MTDVKLPLAAEGEERCHINFPANDFNDVSGCLKKYAHNDAHICLTNKGEYMEWEDDYECKCGCWDEWEAGDSRVCMVYRVVGNTTLDSEE
jgi:hypothetical protein